MYLLQHIAKLQVVVVFFFQLVNFTQIDSLLGEDSSLFVLHYFLLFAQLLIFVGANVYRHYYPEKYEFFINKYLFLESSLKERQRRESQLLDEEIKQALVKAYEHPIHTLERRV